MYPMNTSEYKVGEEMIPELHGGGCLLGDGEYDANPVFDAAGAAGYQLLAPREQPEAGLGHHCQSPYRLRCIELMKTALHQLYLHWCSWDTRGTSRAPAGPQIAYNL